ncbi:MAG: prepilin-type N-terminal cleavage/methylation domain-containing protein [candidate division WOR-3 bacterium]
MRLSKGFSLLELLVALFILSIGLLGVVPLAITTIRLNAFQNQLLNAKFLAERQAEYLKSISFDSQDLSNDGDNSDLDNTITPDHNIIRVMDNITYNVMWNIAENPDGTRTVNIIVQWRSAPRGTIKTYNVTFVRSSYEI